MDRARSTKEALSLRAKFCRACSRKKNSAVVLQEFQAHAQWVASNLDVMRSRSGTCLKRKLRQRESKEECRIYQWLYYHACDLEPGSLLAQQLAIVEAFLTKSVDALLQEYQEHAALVQAASVADAAVEAGAHAGACSLLLKHLAKCTEHEVLQHDKGVLAATKASSASPWSCEDLATPKLREDKVKAKAKAKVKPSQAKPSQCGSLAAGGA